MDVQTPTLKPAPPASPRQWTSEQLLAIRTTGRSLLVSAAAGSGKTSVLAERCAYLVCDAPQKCSVGQLLVVTFTEAAALEMKTRIEQTLRRRIESAGDDPHLRKQLALLDHASVSTLHSFCNRVLRQHFHRVGLDPAFRVMDGDEATLLRLEIARDLFAERYDREDAAAFQHFIDAFGDGNDEGLVNQVVRTYELLRSLVDPAAWMKRSVGRVEEAIAAPFERSEMGREYIDGVRTRLADLQRDSRAALESISRTDIKPYAAYAKTLLTTAREWTDLLDRDGYDALVAAVRDWQAPKLPSVPAATLGRDAAKGLITPVQNQFKKGPLRDCLRFTSAQWTDGLRSLLPHVKVFLFLIEELARRYRADKDQARTLDFSDLERHTLDLLRDGRSGLNPSPVARLFHKQFQHVLVDEYQDINEVQDAILTLVSRECLAPRATATPNLFCVGDVKQSIYGFRLAEPTRFLDRRSRFRAGAEPSPGQVIDLQANFRSRKPLLDSLNAIFERLMTSAAVDIEYDASQRLIAGAAFPQAEATACFSGAPIELHLLPDKLDAASEPADSDTSPASSEDDELERSEREALLVARRIEEMMGQHGCPRMHVSDKGMLRPIEYRDIVILLRATRYHSDEYADVLRRRNIPVYNASGGGYFDAMEIRDVLSLLRLLDNPLQDIPMAAVLRSPLSGLPRPDDSLARIRLAYSNTSPVLPFHEAVVRYASEKDDELAAKLRDFLRDLRQWRETARQRPVADLIWDVFERTGFLAFCSGLENGAQRCANLLHLHEKARQFGTFSRQGLYRFVRFLEGLREETDLAQASDLGEAENVVRLMSVHKSKGLEFPVVIVPELGKRINFQSAQGNIVADRQACLGMLAIDDRKQVRYPSLASVLVTERLKRQTLAEELRVLYVALTRAKEHLILVGTCGAGQAEKWERAWATHAGPMPPSSILAARTMLDWLGPVAAMTVTAGAQAIQTYDHPADEVQGWIRESTAADARPPGMLEQLARLQPLPAAPADHPQASDIIRRLTWTYPARPFTRLPAAQAVTDLSAPALPLSPSPALAPLPKPKFLLDQQFLTAAERGRAVHLFLQHLDFTRPCDDADLSDQLAALHSRKLLSPAQTRAVDLATVRWFLDTDLGRLIRQRASHCLRELPINYAQRTEGAADLDAVMLRGRIDLLLSDADGLILVDYKTDVLPPNAAPARAAAYRPQVDLYRQAVQRITGRPVTAAHLVFLTARHIETL